MEKNIYDEQNGLTYTLVGDFYLPDLLPPQEEVPVYGKYGFLRLKYLKEHKRALYTSLVTQGRLTEHLNSIDHDAIERVERLVELMKVQQGITEELKGRDQMKWVGMMYSIKCSAEEMVLQKLIYA